MYAPSTPNTPAPTTIAPTIERPTPTPNPLSAETRKELIESLLDLNYALKSSVRGEFSNPAEQIDTATASDDEVRRFIGKRRTWFANGPTYWQLSLGKTGKLETRVDIHHQGTNMGNVLQRYRISTDLRKDPTNPILTDLFQNGDSSKGLKPDAETLINAAHTFFRLPENMTWEEGRLNSSQQSRLDVVWGKWADKSIFSPIIEVIVGAEGIIDTTVTLPTYVEKVIFPRPKTS